VVFLVLQVLEYFLAGLLVLFLEGAIGEGKLPGFCSFFIFLIPLEFGALLCFPHYSQVDLFLLGIAEGFLGLFDRMPGLFGSGVFAFVGVQDHREGFVLFFDFLFGGYALELEDVVGVVEFLVGESLDFNFCFEDSGFDGFVFDGIDFFAIVVDLLFGLIRFTHSLLIFNSI
jgi:hypothetical protein